MGLYNHEGDGGVFAVAEALLQVTFHFVFGSWGVGVRGREGWAGAGGRARRRDLGLVVAGCMNE